MKKYFRLPQPLLSELPHGAVIFKSSNMLSSISWQHYLAAIIILTVSYYGYVILRYYQKEISNLFNRKQDNPTLFPNTPSAPHDVMGEARLGNGVSLAKSEDLLFADASPDEAQIADNPDIQNSISEITYTPSQELEVEAGNLITAFQEIDNKPEFITLMRILIDSYKRFKDEIDLPDTLNRVIELSKEKLMFPINLTDLQITWAS